jgi:hypothetical protein
MYKGGKLKMWTKERKFATTSKASTPTYIENSSTHFLKKKYSYSINQVSGTVTYTYV